MTLTTRRAAPDPDRRVLRLTGPDRRRFLQGLVSNDVNRLDREPLVYASLLSPQGKYLSEMVLAEDGEALLLDVPAQEAEDLLRRLTIYRLRSAVAIEATDLPVTRGLGPPPPGAAPDPRDAELGWRLIGRALTEGDPVDWPALHVARRVPRHGSDLVPGESYILENGFARLNGVDFRKGCYVGQEITARMQHKAELRRGLVVLALGGPAEPGTPVLTAEGREAGRLGTVAGTRALALLRLDRAAGPLTVDGATATAETLPA